MHTLLDLVCFRVLIESNNKYERTFKNIWFVWLYYVDIIGNLLLTIIKAKIPIKISDFRDYIFLVGSWRDRLRDFSGRFQIRIDFYRLCLIKIVIILFQKCCFIKKNNFQLKCLLIMKTTLISLMVHSSCFRSRECKIFAYVFAYVFIHTGFYWEIY